MKTAGAITSIYSLGRTVQMSMVLIIGLLAIPIGAIADSNIQSRIETVAGIYDGQDQSDLAGGFAAAVLKDGRIEFSKAYGFANQEHSIPFTTSTVFDFASVAKQFTGFAIAKLVQDGKIGLDDDIRMYLPETPTFEHTVTIRHLLGHTSGLRDFVPLARISGYREGDEISTDLLMRIVCRQEDLNFAPGQMYMYSNTGYFLLAWIVERVTGQVFPEWTRENIFAPLAMVDTSFRDDHELITKGVAASYAKGSNGDYIALMNGLEACGASSLFSTLDDMCKWVANFDSHKHGGEALWRMMLEPVTLNDGTISNYNFGLEIGETRDRRSIGHGGSWRGYLSSVVHLPAERLSVIFMANRSPSGVYVRDEVLRILLDEEGCGHDHSGDSPNADRPVADVEDSVIDRYVGTYAYRIDHPSGIYDEAEVFRKDGNFVFHSFLYRNNRLFPASETEFFIIGDTNTFTFHTDGEGWCKKVVVQHNGEVFTFHRVERTMRNKPRATEYVGNYFSRELDTSYAIAIREGVVTASSFRNGSISLSRVGTDRYLSDQNWFEEVVFTRDDMNRIDGFLLQTCRGNGTVDLRFTRKP